MRSLMMFGSLVALLAACGGEEPEQGVGTLIVRLSMESTNPGVGRNRLRIDVSDPVGLPIAGASVAVHAEMRGHGHGSSEKAKVKELKPGHYEGYPVTLQMPGVWTISANAELGQQHGAGTLNLTVH